jgi:hypothetical protein
MKCKMTITEFNNLPFEEKFKFVFSEKSLRLISYREYFNQKVTLFDAGTFFIETFFFPVENKFLKIQGIDQDDKAIDIYINQMKKSKE